LDALKTVAQFGLEDTVEMFDVCEKVSVARKELLEACAHAGVGAGTPTLVAPDKTTTTAATALEKLWELGERKGVFRRFPQEEEDEDPDASSSESSADNEIVVPFPPAAVHPPPQEASHLTPPPLPSLSSAPWLPPRVRVHEWPSQTQAAHPVLPPVLPPSQPSQVAQLPKPPVYQGPPLPQGEAAKAEGGGKEEEIEETTSLFSSALHFEKQRAAKRQRLARENRGVAEEEDEIIEIKLPKPVLLEPKPTWAFSMTSSPLH